MIGSGHGASAAGEEAVESREPVRLDLAADGLALREQSRTFMGVLLLASGHAFARFVEGSCHDFNVRPGLRQRGFVGVGALQACELIIFQALDLRLGEGEFVLQGFCLRWGRNGIALGAKALGTLAMLRDIAFQAGADGFFAGKGVG